MCRVSKVMRVILVFAAFAVLYGCGQANSPVEKQEKRGGAKQVAPEPETEVPAVSQPAASKPERAPEPTTPAASAVAGMSGEHAVLAKGYCRIVTYASEKNMSQQELSAFIDQTADQAVNEMESDPSLTVGAAGNKVLDDLEVPRYPECKVDRD